MAEVARGALMRLEWRDGLDLTGVPVEVIQRTDHLFMRAATLLAPDVEDTERAQRLLEEVLDLWSVAPNDEPGPQS